MFRWLGGDSSRQKDSKAFVDVTEGLQRLYREKLLPVETEHDFHHFYSPALTDADFSARPMVLLIGQYSAGKSTFIRHLLGRDYPGLRIGPEPTTDKFVAVCNGTTDQVIPGNALVVDKSMPFTQLSHFGNAFLSRFEAAKLASPCLEGITLIDTPGVLAGEKQRIKRGYEFESIVKWFADRVDMILMLFDVSKLDISDEFRRVILAVKGNDHKIHIVLNKADRCTTSQLMRVYGAMMWNLGKVIDTPEVSRVYIGSFWDEPLSCDEQRRLFETEENDLYTALAQLPRSAAVRKLNDLIKRARLAKVHAYLMAHLKAKMPTMMGKDKKQKELIANITTVYQEIAKERGVALGDFPDPKMMQEKLGPLDFKKFSKLDKKKMDALDEMLNTEVPKLLQMIPSEAETAQTTDISQVGTQASPFAVMKTGGNTETTVYQNQWLISPDIEDYKQDFLACGPNAQGRLTGQKAKPKLVESKLPSNVLHKIWTLADVDKDGTLTLYEFALAMHFIKMRLDGHDLPTVLPENMMSPGGREPPGDQESASDVQ
jgi:GTP-binding protein EngB required for normal cell division